MFQLPSRLEELALQHRHSDGSWSALERVHHDPSQHDPERDWEQGAIFVCKSCEEEVRIAPPTGPRDSHDR